MTTKPSAFAAVRAGAAIAIQRAFSAAVWFVLLALAGAGLLIGGVYILAGMGAAMVAGGTLCGLTACLLLIGMTRGA